MKKIIDILLVEDSESDRLLALETLRDSRLANAVHCVEDGEEALAFLRREGKFRDAPRPDLILLDLNLPRKDGREVLAEIKEDTLLRLIPVVVLTTSKADADVLAAYGFHANCYITKPLDFARFSEVAASLGNFWFQIVTLPPVEALIARGRPLPELVATTPVRQVGDLGKECRVLIVEDSPSDRFILEETLADSKSMRFTTVVAECLAEAEQRLRKNRFDVVVADLGLPDSQGSETVRALCRACVGTPLIVLTAVDDEQVGLEILREGAADYVVKGQISGRALARSIRYVVDKKNIDEQLRHAQRMDGMGVLAGGVAHDFNNLLTIIRGNVELIRELRPSEADRASFLGQIITAADRASALTRQLLTFSRKQEIKAEALDLNVVIGDFTKMMRRLLGPTILVELQFSASPPIVFADCGMIEQVVMNLMVNARDAMPSGGRVSLRTEVVQIDAGGTEVIPVPVSGDYAQLVVADSGGGIPAELLPRIFEPFFTTKAIGRGTGLGLSTVFGIIQTHRGGLAVKSVPGKGTTFFIRLPLAPAVEKTEVAETAVAPKAGGTILVVDDEAIVRDLTVSMLRHRGHDVLSASSATEALAMWPGIESRVRLLLTDMMMPEGISGEVLADDLMKRKPGLRVVYMSGLKSGRSASRLDLREGDNFLSKPYTLASLGAIVAKALAD